jgi:hypothetical protein
MNFFEDIYDAIKKHINFEIVRVVMVGRSASLFPSLPLDHSQSWIPEG